MKAKGRQRGKVVVCLALAALIAGALVVAHTSEAARRQDKGSQESHTPEPRGKVAFAADLEDNFEIYVVNPEGGGPAKVTNNAAEDFDPSFAPDGARLAFVSARDGNQEIYAVGAGGAGETRLTNNAAADLDPAWSPDGARLAFTSERDGNQNVYVMNADGTNVTRLTDSTAADFRPAWSPDGARLAFTSTRDGNDEIYVMNADGSNQTNVSNNAADDLNPAWSPMRITFQSTRDGNDEIYSMNADGSNQTRLTNNPAFDGRPARTMDGSRVVFVSDRDGNFELYAANADGSNPVRLTSTEETELDPDVQPLTTAVPAGVVRFSAASVTVNEGAGSVSLTVTRAGNTSAGALVDFSTVSGSASDRSDFTPAFGVLEFAAGETSKTITVPVIDDAFAEPDETFAVGLGNATGASLGGPSTVVVTIVDNDNAAAGLTLFAVTTSNSLLRFNSAAPGTLISSTAITGLQSGENVLGIDVRPATFQLYALGSTGRLYVVNPASGRAQQVSTLSTAPGGGEFGVDFNPVPDRLRVTSDAEQNLRINVDTGAATVDGALAFAPGDPNAGRNPNVVGSAYTNSVAGATATTLYNIDSNLDILVTQNPPNDGRLNTVGALGVDTSGLVGFDIAAAGNVAFATLTPQGEATSRLYTVNLSTGAATLVGAVGGPSAVRALAVANLPANPIDDTVFFVRQQYLDFLGREPDAAGLAFWTNELTTLISRCPAPPAADRARCVLFARAQVSTAFFLSIEFVDTGYLVIRVYQEALNRLPTLREFLADAADLRRGVVVGQAGALERLAANRRDFVERFVQREEFRARFDGVANAAYVNALFTNAGVNPAAEAATRDALLTGLGNGTETRATALVRVADTGSVYNALFNRAFVLMQYFGYLRREPDAPGFQFWLNKLNSFSLPGEDVRNPATAVGRARRAEMVEAFIDSGEYRSRFGQP